MDTSATPPHAARIVNTSAPLAARYRVYRICRLLVTPTAGSWILVRHAKTYRFSSKLSIYIKQLQTQVFYQELKCYDSSDGVRYGNRFQVISQSNTNLIKTSSKIFLLICSDSATLAYATFPKHIFIIFNLLTITACYSILHVLQPALIIKVIEHHKINLRIVPGIY